MSQGGLKRVMAALLVACLTGAAAPSAPFRDLGIWDNAAVFYNAGSVERSGQRLSVKLLWFPLLSPPGADGRPAGRAETVVLDCDWLVRLSRLDGAAPASSGTGPLALEMAAPLVSTLCDPRFEPAAQTLTFRAMEARAEALILNAPKSAFTPPPFTLSFPEAERQTFVEEPFAYGLIDGDAAMGVLRYFDWDDVQRSGGKARVRIMTVEEEREGASGTDVSLAVLNIDCAKGEVEMERFGRMTPEGATFVTKPPAGRWQSAGRPVTARTVEIACCGKRPAKVARTLDDVARDLDALKS